MRKFLFLFAFFAPLSARAQWTTVGLNFRQTSGYVTDSTGETYVLGETSSTSRDIVGPQGNVTFQWSTCGDCVRDRSTGVGSRLAGIHFVDNSAASPATFSLTLPQAGNYTICLALGDATNPQAYQKAEVFDNVTSKFSVTDADGTSADHWDDANGTDRTSGTWAAPGAQCRSAVAFASTTLNLKLGATTSQSGSSTLSHLYVGLESSSQPLSVLEAMGEL